MGTEVFNLICGGMEIEQIVDALIDKYEVEHDILRADIISLIDEMKKKNIIIEK